MSEIGWGGDQPAARCMHHSGILMPAASEQQQQLGGTNYRLLHIYVSHGTAQSVAVQNPCRPVPAGSTVYDMIDTRQVRHMLG
jgi:hypothetical protein